VVQLFIEVNHLSGERLPEGPRPGAPGR